MADWNDIEACRLMPAIGEPAVRPSYFDSRYVLPVHGENLLLQTSNKHERDDRIQFYEKPHIYTVDDKIVSQSISSLAHDFEEPFDGSVGISAMMNSKRESWPRKAYVINPVKVEKHDLDVTKGCLLYDEKAKITIASINKDDSRTMTPHDLIHMLSSIAIFTKNKDITYYNFDREESNEEILAKWAANGEEARNRGTEAHLQMELWFNSLPVRLDDPEVQVGLNFIRTGLLPLGAKGYKSEWEIHGEDEDVAGSIDLAVILPDGSLYLIDWKRSEKLKSKMKGYKRMKEPLNNLEDCSGCSYALQLSSYQYIIEKYYGFKVTGRALVSLHPDAPFTTTVPYLRKEVDYIMKRRQTYNTTRKMLEKNPENAHLLCYKTGRLAENAMKDEEGNIYWAKAAQFFELEDTLTECVEVKNAIKELFAKELKPVPYPHNLVEWKHQFPAPNSDLLSNRV